MIDAMEKRPMSKFTMRTSLRTRTWARTGRAVCLLITTSPTLTISSMSYTHTPTTMVTIPMAHTLAGAMVVDMEDTILVSDTMVVINKVNTVATTKVTTLATKHNTEASANDSSG